MRTLLTVVLVATISGSLTNPCASQSPTMEEAEAEALEALAELLREQRLEDLREAEAKRGELIQTMEGDPRVRVSEATLEPKFYEASKAVGKLRIKNKASVVRDGKEVEVDATSQASCVLVAPDVAVTSAHVYDSENSPSSVLFGYRDGRSLHETRVAKVASHDMEIDIAVIVLEEPVPAHVARPVTLAPKKYRDHFPWYKDKYGASRKTQLRWDAVAIGFSSDQGIGQGGELLTADADCAISVHMTRNNALGYSSCISYPGSSGGGVFLEEDGAVVLLGIISGGNGEYDFIEDRSMDFINKEVFEERVAATIREHAPETSGPDR